MAPAAAAEGAADRTGAAAGGAAPAAADGAAAGSMEAAGSATPTTAAAAPVAAAGPWQPRAAAGTGAAWPDISAWGAGRLPVRAGTRRGACPLAAWRQCTLGWALRDPCRLPAPERPSSPLGVKSLVPAERLP